MTGQQMLVLLVLQMLMIIAQGREFCEEDYLCDVGHCCGNGECCTYYYELWWFWLVWFLIVFVIGFCVWQRKKLRPWREQQQHHNSCGLCGPPDLYPDILPIPPVKLPTYAEIGETVSFNTPPPPYTCECYMGGLTTGRVGSFDQPPPESGAPPCYMQYAQIIAPLMPRVQRNNSTGTQFPEGIPTTAITISTEQVPLVETADSLVQTDSSTHSPDSPCLSCSSPSSPLTSRSCSCSSIQIPSLSSSVVPARPGQAVSARLVSDLYLKPTWFQFGSFSKGNGLATHIQSGSRLQVPFSGSNFNPCPRCVSRSVSSLRHNTSATIMRDASTSTLTQVDPNQLETQQTTSRNQEPDRFERRNSYSLPRNFVCSTKLKE